MSEPWDGLTDSGRAVYVMAKAQAHIAELEEALGELVAHRDSSGPAHLLTCDCGGVMGHKDARPLSCGTLQDAFRRARRLLQPSKAPLPAAPDGSTR